MDRQERKVEPTARLRATAEDGREVTLEQRTEFLRTQYADGTWSNWIPGLRTFWLGTERLGVLDACTLRTARGEHITLAPPGVG